MQWTTNQLLQNHNQNTPCKAIFQAVCDEIGQFYAQKGFKYTPSYPKLTLEKNGVKLEIGFFSSRMNTPGKWVQLEIIPTFSSKTARNTENPKGFLLIYPTIFYKKTDEMPPKLTVQHIFGEVETMTENWLTESNIRDYHACNVFGLTETNFGKIIAFIDQKIIARWPASI
jgi:hypothetical protein